MRSSRVSSIRRWGLAGVSLLAVALLASCAQETGQGEAGGSAIDKTFERGPMTLRLKVDHDQITIADRIQLTLEAEVDEGYQVEMPKFGEKLEQFGIVDFREPPPVLADEGRVLHTRTYTLEPFLSGDYTIPPMKVQFWKEDEEERHDAETEAVTIKVASLLPEEVAELQIKEIVPPVEIPRQVRYGLYGLVLGVLAVLLAAGYLLWRRRGKAEAEVMAIPPHEIAFRALEALLADDLIAKGQFKDFYNRVSDILRRFLEGRFGLHAPEQTTEEFLADIRTRNVLSEPHKKLLREFLQHCDLVKFAEQQPTNDEIQRTFDLCKQFVLDTGGAPQPEAAPTDGGLG